MSKFISIRSEKSNLHTLQFQYKCIGKNSEIFNKNRSEIFCQSVLLSPFVYCKRINGINIVYTKDEVPKPTIFVYEKLVDA